MKKNTYFIIKNVTEFDHIIPLINSLDSNKYNIWIDFFNPVLNRHNIEQKFKISINPHVEVGYFFFSKKSFFSKFFFNSFLKEKYSDLNFSYLRKNFKLKFLFISIIKKIFLSNNLINNYIFSEKWIYNKIKSLSPEIIFIDNSFESSGIYEKLSSVADKLNIRTYEYPHSLYLGKRSLRKRGKYKKNIVLFNSDYEKKVSSNFDFSNEFKIYGSFKYDYEWQKKFKKKNDEKNKELTNIIYVMTNFEELDKNLELQSIKLLSSFKNVNLILVPPSRDNFNLNYSFINENKSSKFIIEKNYSLSTLVNNADMYITSISGGIMDGIYNFKKIICLKFLCNTKIRNLTFFNYDPFFTFESYEDLKNNFQDCLNYKLSLSDKKNYVKYMKKYVIPYGRRNIIKNFIKNEID